MKIKSYVFALAVAVMVPTTVFAADLWTSGSCVGSQNSSGYYATNASITCGPKSVGTTAVTTVVSAWSATSGTSAWDFAAATIGNWSGGLGVLSNSSDSSHTMDNSGSTDALLFHFIGSDTKDLKVALSSITTGYVLNGVDSDISVMSYTGNTGTAPNIDSSKLNAMGSSWNLVGHYANGSAAGTFNINTANTVSSSWWLISAYNALYGAGSTASDKGTGSTSYVGSTPLTRSDGVKLLSVAGALVPPTGQTPEPAGIALVGLGLLGLMASRRRTIK
jgi:hypothetical protein